MPDCSRATSVAARCGRSRRGRPAQVRGPRFALLPLALLLATACDSRPGADAGAVPDSLGSARPPADTGAALPGGAAADTGGAAVLARWERLLPQAARFRRGACPFECCTYREWTAESAITVRQRERGGEAAFTMEPGQSFRADSGNVWITGVQLVAVRDSVGDPPYWSFAPGDTLLVLDHLGEGHFNVWHDGQVRDVEGFWVFRPETVRTLGAHRSEWWVHVTLPDGRSGWFEAGDSVRIGNADACG